MPKWVIQIEGAQDDAGASISARAVVESLLSSGQALKHANFGVVSETPQSDGTVKRDFASRSDLLADQQLVDSTVGDGHRCRADSTLAVAP